MGGAKQPGGLWPYVEKKKVGAAGKEKSAIKNGSLPRKNRQGGEFTKFECNESDIAIRRRAFPEPVSIRRTSSLL